MELDRHPSRSTASQSGMDDTSDDDCESRNSSLPDIALARTISSSLSIMTSLNPHQQAINRRTILKLDYILLPFLSLLFLLNAIDKSNVGNAGSAHFTEDLGLPRSALNRSVACFWAVFVSVQPLGAALGKRYGMARWVPTCMALWGVCTALHIAVRHEWQLITLRVLVAILEAGFYPTTVNYLSSFYTRYEFGKRLGIFYGQSALAGAVGGLLSWAVFNKFPGVEPSNPTTPSAIRDATAARSTWKSWEILFLIEGTCTILVALVGFWWLPHSAETAWFFTKEESEWAEERIRQDCNAATLWHPHAKFRYEGEANSQLFFDSPPRDSDQGEDDRLLSGYVPPEPRPRKGSVVSHKSVTADAGLVRLDVVSAIMDWKIWYLLVCNILSAIPTTAFAVFLPLVIQGLTANDQDMTPARANLLAIPPFLGGTVVLWTFTWYSDRTHKRLTPILYGLGILLAGLTATIMFPPTAYAARYVALIVLLSGSFIASPLTVAWLTNNTPEPGKRAIVLGINGWGNLAGVFSAMLFSPRYESEGYVTPFYVTTACVLVAFIGYAGFGALMVSENRRRGQIVDGWNNAEVQREALLGNMPLPGREGALLAWLKSSAAGALLDWAKVDGSRRGDEKLTFKYGL